MFLVMKCIVDTLGIESLIQGTLDFQKEREKGDVSKALAQIDAPVQIGVVVIRFLHGAALFHIWVESYFSYNSVNLVSPLLLFQRLT